MLRFHTSNDGVSRSGTPICQDEETQAVADSDNSQIMIILRFDLAKSLPTIEGYLTISGCSSRRYPARMSKPGEVKAGEYPAKVSHPEGPAKPAPEAAGQPTSYGDSSKVADTSTFAAARAAFLSSASSSSKASGDRIEDAAKPTSVLRIMRLFLPTDSQYVTLHYNPSWDDATLLEHALFKVSKSRIQLDRDLSQYSVVRRAAAVRLLRVLLPVPFSCLSTSYCTVCCGSCGERESASLAPILTAPLALLSAAGLCLHPRVRPRPHWGRSRCGLHR